MTQRHWQTLQNNIYRYLFTNIIFFEKAEMCFVFFLGGFTGHIFFK